MRRKLEATYRTSWDEIFAALAPAMIHEISEQGLRKEINTFIEMKEAPGIREHADPRNFLINESDFQTIKVQLRALGLIVRSEKARSVKDVDTYWTLTPYGDNLMTRLRAIKRKSKGS